MKDEFDDYFEKHRQELDVDEPERQYLWEGIEAQLTKKKYRKRLQFWKVAAAVLALLAIGESAYLLIHTTTAPPRQITHKNGGDDAKVNGAFEALETSYQKEVEALRQQVDSKKINPSEYAMLLEELHYIEEVEDDFKSDIPLVNDKERLAQILVDTYEKKIKLLERLLQQIERNEKQQEKLEQSFPVDNKVKSLSL